MIKCAFCGKPLEWEGKVYRNDTCPNCGRDVGSYNQCKETIAERVVDKEKANFCEHFALRGDDSNCLGKEAEAKKALEDLFKKKG